MFDSQELKQLEMLFNQSEGRMAGKISESEVRMVGKIGESEERMAGKISESEDRMVGKIGESEKRLVSKIGESEKRTHLKIDQLSTDIGEMIDNTILPMIAEKADKSDIVRLERKLDKVIDKVAEHDTELRKIKSQVFVS